MGNTHWLAALVLVVLGAPACAGPAPRLAQPTPAAVLSNIEKARLKQDAALAALSPLQKEIVLLANFEQDAVFLGNSRVLPVELETSHFRAGKFGRGYFFEKPRHNLLPASRADVETDVSAFQAQAPARVASVPAQTPFGPRVLAVFLPEAGATVRTTPAKVAFRLHLGHEKTVALLASCFVKGPRDARLKAEVAFLPKDLPTPPAGKAEAAPAQPDKPFPQEITLTGDWRRVACYATGDARLPEREAVLTLSVAGGAPFHLLADHFQFEQSGYYPHNHLVPTTWIPGGQTAPATFADLAGDLRAAFPTHEGTIAFWTATPRDTNLTGIGGIYWLSFGIWWRDPIWSMGTYTMTTGDKFCYFRGANVTDGAWHHLAMAWDAAKAAVFVDGKPLSTYERTDPDIAGKLEQYRMRLGGSVQDGQAANSVLDEIVVFKRRLADTEVVALAGATAPLVATPNRALFSAGPRTVFYRDEPSATLQVQLTRLGAATAPVDVDLALGDLVAGRSRVTPPPGSAALRQSEIRNPKSEIAPLAALTFSPARLKAGTYPCRVASLLPDGSAVYHEFPVEIVPALRPDHYVFSSWASGAETADWRGFCRRLGLNSIDTYATNIETLGKEGFLYGWHYNFGNGVWSPANREAVRAQTRQGIQERSLFPNWRYTLFNSEVAPWVVPDDAARASWFDAWARKELGAPIPAGGWKMGTTHNPIQCWFTEGQKPGKDGIYKVPETFRFLKWWYNRGCGWWRLNAEAAAEVRKTRPDVLLWTDPLWYPGQVADLDAGSTWSYQTAAEPLVGEFETSYAALRGTDKQYFATLGLHYVAGDWLTVTEPDGKKKSLMPTPDDAIQQAWLAVAHIPTDGVTYWYLDGWYHGLRGAQEHYCPPDSLERLGEAITRDLMPLGTMLKHVPNAQRPIGLLLPETTQWMDAGEGGWGWGTAHYPNNWRAWLGTTGIPCDVILDNNITPGALARYKVLFFPMAEYVSEEVHRELVAAANGGTRIIVDAYCRQDYPHMERWDQEYYHKMPAAKRAGYGKATLERLGQLRQQLLPDLEAYAVGEEGKLLTNIREYHGVKYVSIVNDNRQEGPYTQWTKKPEFKPYGKAQRVKAVLRAPQESAVYEFTQSRRLPTTWENGRLVVSVDLPPHAGRLLCLYPKPLAEVAVQAGPCRLGVPTRIAVTALDGPGHPAPGRQLIEARLLDPAGKEHDESGLYRMADGKVAIPFRPALNDPPGTWRIEVRERTSGLTASAAIRATK